VFFFGESSGTVGYWSHYLHVFFNSCTMPEAAVGKPGRKLGLAGMGQ